MTVFRIILLLCLLGSKTGIAQLIYQGPKPEALFTAAAEQAFLADFTAKFKTDFETTTQYATIQKTGIDAWEMTLFDARKAQSAFYKAYPQTSQFSAAFNQYVEASIRWNYWHLLLAYPIVRGNIQTTQQRVMALPSVMEEELTTLAVNDEAALPAESYQNFLFYYITYVNSKARNYAKYTPTDIHTNLTDKVAIARKHLTGKPYQYALARLLIENCDKSTPSSVRDVFALLSGTPSPAGYVAAVKTRCGAVMARKDEPIAKAAASKKVIDPNTFSFTNQNGEPVTFDDFKGKVVYLDVWASWCGPCRAEFPFSKQLHERLSKKQKEQVVFLYLSIDDTEEVWKNALKTLQLPGEQGWSKGGWRSRVVQYFGIQGIPRYVLLNKKGQVVDAEAKRPSSADAIWQDILKLMAE